VAKVGGTPFIGSHLLGCFGAGMAWVNVPRSHAIWEKQMKRVVRWMMRLFFSATVGFAVPVGDLFDGTAIWRGAVLGVGPCIATKLFSGLFAWIKYKDEEAKEMAKSASCATKCLQPQQLLVGIAMVARGEFAYLVAETAQTTPYQGSDVPGMTMMSAEVYAAVVWALVWATITAPIMFRWAIGVFDRATPIHRSDFIGGDSKDYARRAFVIRVAAKYTPGVQRDLFNALHGSGVDVLDAVITSVRKDDSPDAPIEQFINSFTVLSRGKKKDFDNEKLEEMHHHFSEILNDSDAQIIFAPPQDAASVTDSVVEVQIIGEHHPVMLRAVTDVLSDMGLDVIKGHFDHSVQPGHHPDHKSTPKTQRLSTSGNAPAPAEASNGLSEISVEVAGGEQKKSPKLKRAASGALSHVMYTTTKEKSTKTLKTSSTKDVKEEHTHTVGTGMFYARESDTGVKVNSERLHKIKDALRAVMHEHHLHGEVMVRALHASEMALVHTVPKLDEDAKVVSVVKIKGSHHKELLHEICEYFDNEAIDIVHAELDQEDGHDVNLFYIKKVDGTVLTEGGRGVILAKIESLYTSHSLAYADVKIETISEMTLGKKKAIAPVSPSKFSERISDGRRPSQAGFNATVQMDVSTSSASAM